ncbi:Flp pilus assembly complex ATPase component TadA [Acinetobacter sp. B5B]|uniref:ATPase, T2SS/T4P/T4SS family n=1 Tax=Acinetobacter baretiae TaxID=2605383 RepID=UPI0018C2A5A1|nr:ATPase, T2SS/T4P/T4SS family [Acinetobacter baretiae]MBF7683651.1 Flp pilus assembly complex ATPase component TadA [Acinetobacter baretiae]
MNILLEVKGESTSLSFEKDEITIGKSKRCDLQLKGWFIADEHCSIKKLSGGYVIEDLKRGTNGTIVNGKKIDFFGPIDLSKDIIQINQYTIKILEDEQQKNAPQIINIDTLDEKTIENIKEPDIESHIKGFSTQISQINHRSTAYKKLEIEWINTLREKLVIQMDLRRKDINSMSYDELKLETLTCLDKVVFEESEHIPVVLDISRLKQKVTDEAIGLGPLEELIADKSVTEIMVNAKDEIFIEQKGQIVKSDLEFTSNKAILDVIERIVTPLGRRIDESAPMVDARLKDGSRVNAIIPPLAIKGPTITIRKFPEKNIMISDLVGFGSVDDNMADFLELCVKSKRNIIISGGTGSGKTTLLNVLANFIPHGERVITIEDAAELRLAHDHLISLEARPGNSEGKGSIHIRDLVKNSLRMRPDRIVIGECRGAEALDMLQAMNTGHEGSLTTLHANTPRDALARLETMILMAGMDLPLSAIREQITSAVDVVIQQSRFSCGSRKVTYITEITGIESGKIQLQDIYKFEKEGFDLEKNSIKGSHKAQGTLPTFMQEVQESGFNIDISKFQSNGM